MGFFSDSSIEDDVRIYTNPDLLLIYVLCKKHTEWHFVQNTPVRYEHNICTYLLKVRIYIYICKFVPSFGWFGGPLRDFFWDDFGNFFLDKKIWINIIGYIRITPTPTIIYRKCLLSIYTTRYHYNSIICIQCWILENWKDYSNKLINWCYTWVI